MTRTGKVSKSLTKEHQGRPVGFLAAWLLKGSECVSLEEHRGELTPLTLVFSQYERLEAREYLMTLPNGDTLVSFERPLRDGEPSEPLLFQ